MIGHPAWKLLRGTTVLVATMAAEEGLEVAWQTVTGKKPWVAPIPAFLAKRAMPKEFLDMFTWIREKGFKANIAEVRKENPQMLTFAGWVSQEAGERLFAASGHKLSEMLELANTKAFKPIDLGLRIRPAAQTASMRLILTSPVAASTPTSTKCDPKVDCW